MEIDKPTNAQKLARKGPECHFGFPKLPCDETIISIPIDKANENEIEEFKCGKAM